MERLKERLEIAQKALERLEEILVIEDYSDVERDAAIQRFEFTFETVWKAAKDYLFVVEGIEAGSPKGVIRSCREIGVLDDEETEMALHMTDDRNLTVHTYNEKLAGEIFQRIRVYAPLLRKWLKGLTP